MRARGAGNLVRKGLCGQRGIFIGPLTRQGTICSSIWGWLSTPEILGKGRVCVCVEHPLLVLPRTRHLGALLARQGWAVHLFKGPRNAHSLRPWHSS